METQDSEQPGATLDALAIAATNAEGERDEAAAGGSSAGEKKKHSQYKPVTDEAELAALRSQGLTDKGESKVAKGDLRCRPPKLYSETFFDKKLPQFRLKTVVDTIRAEDIVMTWAHVTGRDKNLRTSEFRFDTKNYVDDEALIADLKALGNSSDAMVAYLKARFGRIREPGVEPSTAPAATTTATATATIYQGSLVNSNQPAPAAVPPHQQQQIKQEGAPAEYVLPIKSARDYVKEFKNSLLKKMRIMAKKQGKSTEIALTAKEEKECEVRALHKAAWDGQAIAAFDLATRIGDFNAVLNFNYTPLHQVVLGSVGAKRRTNLLTAERLIKTGDSGAHVNAQDVFGRTPLHHASRRGDLDMMDLLIAKGAEVNAVAKNGSTPLHCAAESGGVDAVQKLLAAGATEVSPLARTLSLQFPTRQNSLRGFSDAGSLGLVRQTSIISNAASGSSAASFEWEAAVNVQQCGTALHWAARAGQDVVVRLLIDAGYNVNAKDWHGTTPLQAAAREYKDVFPDRLEVGDYRNYIRNYREKKGLIPPPSERDKSSDYMAVIRYLQCVGSLDKEAVDADGRTALHVAAACGNLKCVKLLLTGDSDGTDMAVQKDKLGFDPLMLSVIKSEPESVFCFMDQSSTESEEMWKNSVDHLLDERNVDDGKDLRGRTALHLAVLGGIPAVVSHLITRNAQVDALDNNGTTPLLLAARTQQLDCVQTLLSKGADPNIVDDLGCSSLSAASLVGDLGIVELLLKNTADVNLTNRSKSEQVGDKRKKGRTALHDAAEAGHVQIVECLIKHGADVNLVSEYGQTPLHVAARYGNADVVQTLIRAGSGINAVDNKGRTALQIAQHHGLMDVVELLKQETQKLHGSIPAEVLRLVGEAEQRAAEQQQPSEDVLEVVEYRDWKSRFNLLNAFVKDYGRIPAPDEWFKGYPLGSWVELQKEKIRWDEMAEDEVEAIGAVGLTLKDWGAGVPWMDWLQSIKEFVAANDKLPSAVAPKEPEEKRNRKASGPTPTREVDEKLLDLGWWCKFQQCRRAGKENGKEKSSLNKNQIKELEALRQWRWELPKDRKIQRRSLCLRLHLFCMKYKRFPRPDEHYLGVPLGKWCEVIRKLKLWGDLPKERQEAIQRCVLNKDKIEIFPGSARDLWNKYRPSENDYLDSLEVFIREQKRAPTHADVGSHSLNVGIWLNNQKQKWKNGKLAADVQKRIEEIFKSNSVPFRWPVDRNSAGGAGDAGDVEMEDAAAVAVATVPPEKKVSKVKAEEEEEDVDAALDLDGNSNIAKMIRLWKAKTSESIELKTAELVEYFQVCRKYKLGAVAQLPSKPAAGSAFFLQRGSKYKQDGYSYKKESNTKLKANGVNVLHGSYITTEDETLQRRMYWELDYPDLIFVQYLAKKGSPSKRKASSQSQQAVKEPLATGLDTLCEAAETEAPSPAPKTKKRALESLSEDSSSNDDDVDEDSSDEDSLNDNIKQRKRRYQGEEKNLLGKAMEVDSSNSDDERVPKRRRHSRMTVAEKRRKEMEEDRQRKEEAKKKAEKEAEEKEARTEALVLACKDGDEAAVKKLISEGVNYDYRTREGEWALVRACENGHKGIVELLLAADASPWDPMFWRGCNTVDFLPSMCEKGHTDILKMLCSAGNVNLSDNKGVTALMYACENGLEVLVKLLLEFGTKIDVNLSDEKGKTALMYASIHGSKPIVELLLKAGARIPAKDNNKWTALVYADDNGNKEVVKMLEADAEGDHAIADKVATDRTMVNKFILACGDGNEVAVQEFISDGVDVDATNAAGETGLMQACRERGHAGVVRLLLDAKSSVNLRCNYEKTALMHACLSHRRDIVELLLDAGVEIDINCRDSRGVTALMYACDNGDDSIVERLCGARANIHSRNNEGETALMYACRNGSKAIVEFLLNAGADVNLGNKNDETALMFACQYCSEAIVELLLNSGAAIDAGNIVGKTALMFACQQDRNQDVVKLLLARGAKIDKKTTNDGKTAFMFACQDGSEAVAELLLKAGADINDKNIRGWTALKYAQNNDHTDIVKMLEEVIASKEQKNPAAETAAATPLLLKPPADTDMVDAEQKKGSHATIELPSQVIEMIASTPVDNYVAVSSAFRSLHDHGVGGQAMRWAALQIVGKKLEDDQKMALFQGVKDYIAQGKLREAVDWVDDFQENWG